MFSSRVETEPPGPNRPRPISLATRLAVTGAASTLAILTVAGALTYWGLAAHLRNLNHEFLHDEFGIVRVLVRSEDYKKELASEILVDHSGEEYVKHYVRLLDNNEQAIIETPGMTPALPHRVFPPIEGHRETRNDMTWQAPDGTIYLLTSQWVDVGHAGGDWGIAEVALDVTNVETVLRTLRGKLLLTLGGGFLLSLGAGLVVARQGTRPLREIAEKTRGISASNLANRIPADHWPKELINVVDALNGMLDRLQDSFGRLYNSAANLTHKLRTPLTILRGEAEVALSQRRTVEELESVLESSLETYERLGRLTDNILFLARAEMGSLHLEPAELDARDEVEKALDFYAPLAEDKGISLTAEGTGRLVVDPALFRRALSAILSNAVIFTPACGRIDISIRERSGTTDIRVTDTGCGIAADDQRKVFDRFFRVYATRQLDPHGSGLGLCIAKAVMDLHHGTIEISSRPGEGTAVTLSLPTK